MGNFLPVLLAVIPVFLVVLAGGLFRRWKMLEPDADQSLLRLTVYLLVPSLILDSVIGNPAVKIVSNVLIAPLLGYALVAVSISIAWMLATVCRLPVETRRTFAFTAGLQNYSYFALPLALLLFDKNTLGVLFLFMMGVETAMWTIAPLVSGSGRLRDGLRKVINPPVMAIFLGLTLNFTGLDAATPEVLKNTFHMLGQCAVPIGLLLVGASMADLAHEFYKLEGKGAMALSVIVRMGLLPPLYILAAVWLPVSTEVRQVLILQGAMPSAVFSLVLMRLYGGHPATALRVIIATLVVGLVGIPFWIQFGLKMLGR